MGVGDSMLAILRRRPFSGVQARYAALCVLNKVCWGTMGCDVDVIDVIKDIIM